MNTFFRLFLFVFFVFLFLSIAIGVASYLFLIFPPMGDFIFMLILAALSLAFIFGHTGSEDYY